MKKILFRIIIILFLSSGYSEFAGAEENFGIGFHLGLHNDVGNLTAYNPDIQYDPQNNYLLGFSFRSNLDFAFIKFSIDNTSMLNKGEVLEDSDPDIASVRINYTSVPLFAGFNYKVMDIGKFYMGPGISYFMARGRITCVDDSLSEDINTSAWALGLVAGIEMNFKQSTRLYCEWQYFNGQSEPAVKTNNTYEWKNYSIDFTGYRMLFGIMYYLI